MTILEAKGSIYTCIPHATFQAYMCCRDLLHGLIERFEHLFLSHCQDSEEVFIASRINSSNPIWATKSEVYQQKLKRVTSNVTTYVLPLSYVNQHTLKTLLTYSLIKKHTFYLCCSYTGHHFNRYLIHSMLQ